MLHLFLADSRRRLGSSKTTVAALLPFSLPKSLCYRLEGKAFGPPSVLSFKCYASCRACQERAGMLKWSAMVGLLLTQVLPLHLGTHGSTSLGF